MARNSRMGFIGMWEKWAMENSVPFYHKSRISARVVVG